MLLDSNAFLFWGLGLDTLNTSAGEAIATTEILSLSVASIWELEIKRGLGKLYVDIDWPAFVRDRLVLIPIEVEDAALAGSLPLHHRDPFDRMIIAQAMRRKLPIVTRDQAFGHYGVPVIWA